MLVSLVMLAAAEPAAVMDKGALVAYAGVGATTYAWLNTGDEGGTEQQREVTRALQSRLDLFGAWVPTDRLQLVLYAPVVYSTVLDTDEAAPCTGATGNCEAITTLGSTAIGARYQLLRGTFPINAGLSVASQAWNADVRRQYTMVGEATTDILPALNIGYRRTMGATRFMIDASASYAYRIPAVDDAEIPGKAPEDDIRASIDFGLASGPFEVHVSTSTLQRLGGTGFYAYGSSDDVWATVDYDAIGVGGKLSYGMANNMGVHLSISRTVWVHNGPVDATDGSLGVHKYWGG